MIKLFREIGNTISSLYYPTIPKFIVLTALLAMGLTRPWALVILYTTGLILLGSAYIFTLIALRMYREEELFDKLYKKLTRLTRQSSFGPLAFYMIIAAIHWPFIISDILQLSFFDKKGE